MQILATPLGRFLLLPFLCIPSGLPFTLFGHFLRILPGPPLTLSSPFLGELAFLLAQSFFLGNPRLFGNDVLARLRQHLLVLPAVRRLGRFGELLLAARKIVRAGAAVGPVDGRLKIPLVDLVELVGHIEQIVLFFCLRRRAGKRCGNQDCRKRRSLMQQSWFHVVPS